MNDDNCLWDEDERMYLSVRNLREVLRTTQRGEEPQLISESPEQTAWVRGLMADENVPPIVKLMVCGMKAGDPESWSITMADQSWMNDIASEIASELPMATLDIAWLWRKGDLAWGLGHGVDTGTILLEIKPSSDTSPISWPEIYNWGQLALHGLRQCSDRTTKFLREFWPDFDPVALLARKGGT